MIKNKKGIMLTFMYVYLGEYPDYVLTNIERTRKIFPTIKIVLSGSRYPDTSWLDRFEVKFFLYIPDREFNAKFNFGEFEPSFRNGYWKSTVERLVAISNYQEKFQNESVLHIESDVIVFSNLPIADILSIRKLAWTRFSENADIASLLYSPNFSTARQLKKMIMAELINTGLSDMEILFKVRQNLKDDFEVLPTTNVNFPQLAPIPCNDPNSSSSVVSQKFAGIFDGAALGSWICGIDPRNKFGFTKIHSRDLIDGKVWLVDPSIGTYDFNSKSELELNVDGRKICIYNLHIHSKNRKLLSVDWEKELRRLVGYQKTSEKIISFDFKILINLILSDAQNKTLINFFKNIPAIKKFRHKKRLIKRKL